MAVFSQAGVADAISHQEVVHPNSVYGSSITPTAGALWALIHMYHGFVQGGTNTDPASFYVQTNLGTTDESWLTVGQFTVTDAAVETENLTATEPSGENVLAVAATANFAGLQYVYIEDNSSVPNSEWQHLQEIDTNVSLTIAGAGLQTGKDNADRITNNAESFSMTLDLSGVARWRVIYMSEGNAAMNAAIWVRYIEVTAIG